MNRQPIALAAMPVKGIFLFASLLLALLVLPLEANARDGAILAGKQRLPLAYRFKKGVRYLPVAPTLKALGVQYTELPKEATLTVQSPWNGQVHVLFRQGELQSGGQVARIEPGPIQRDGIWFLPIPVMEQWLGITGELNRDNDLELAALTRVEQTPTGMQLHTGAPVTPKGFYLDNPPRYVVDLPMARLERKHPDPFPAHETGYKSIRLGQFETTTARIVFDLTDPRWRSPLAGKTGLTLLTLGKVEAPTGSAPLPLSPLRLGIAQDGSGLVLDGLNATGAVLRTKSATELEIEYAGATLSGPLAPYTPAAGTDNGIAKVTLAAAKNGNVVLAITLRRAAASPQLTFDATSGRTIVQFAAVQPDINNHPVVKGVKGRTVVIDPGHGGRWPGATMEPGMVGPTRLLEKDLTLRMSIDLQRRLAALGIRAILTRTDDRVLNEDLKLDLPARLQIATDNKADLFVSVHCNSFRKVPSDALSGTEVYFNKPGDKAVANTVFEHMSRKTGRGGRGALYGELRVTKHPSIPSVLVETGYLSNPDEYALFCDPTHEYEQTLMAGLTDGIVAVLTGQTIQSNTALPEPTSLLPAWMNQLTQHDFTSGAATPAATAEVAPLKPGERDLFSMAGDGAAISPFEAPLTEGLPSIPPPQYAPEHAPQYLPLPNRNGRPAVDPNASALPDPEISFDGSHENETHPIHNASDSDTNTADEGADVPGSTPQERRLSIFSLS